MENEEFLPKPQTDLPLPRPPGTVVPGNVGQAEKELSEHATPALKGETFRSRNLHLPKYLLLGAIFVVLLIIIGASILGGKYYLDQQKLKAINDFESCAAAGNPIQESYPATCRTSDGRSFTQVLTEEEQKNLLPPDTTADWKTYEGSGFSFKYPASWELTKEIPDIYRWREINFTKSDWELDHLNNGMLGNCKGPILVNKTIPTSVIIIEIKETNSDGAYCWSSGDFTNSSKRTIKTLTPPQEIKVVKWNPGSYQFKGVNKSAPWTGTLHEQSKIDGDKQFAAITLIHQDGSDSIAQSIYDQILSTFRFE